MKRSRTLPAQQTMWLSAVMLAVAVACLSGCATVVHQTTQRIPIASSPAGARVLIDSVPVGITPLVATVSRRRSHVVTLIHDSFPAASVSLERSISPWVLGNYMLYIVPAAV